MILVIGLEKLYDFCTQNQKEITKMITKLTIITLQYSKDEAIGPEILSLDFSNLEIQFIILRKDTDFIDNKKNSSEKIESFILSPDDELHFSDLLKQVSGDYISFINQKLNYPNDFFQRIFLVHSQDDETSIPNREEPFNIRLLKACQQSKYGLGLVQQDIQRDFENLKKSFPYQISELQSSKFKELDIEETLDYELFKKAQNSSVEQLPYHPNYKDIVYFSTLDDYIKAIKKDAPKFGIKNRSNASGFPIYFLMIVWISFLFMLLIPPTLVFFLMVLAVYILAIGLESLAISTIKKQGELLIGMIFLLPLLHHVYLIHYIKGWFSKK